jgi:CHASE3 domain sensor protein
VTRRGWWPRTLRWRVYFVVGGLLVLLLLTAGTTTAVRLHLSSIGHQLTGTLRPAQVAVVDLTASYIDMETGERGFLLTRDETFLQPYNLGARDTAVTLARLRTLFSNDAVALRQLTQIARAATAWRTQVIDPELAAFRAGTLTGPALVATISRGKDRFDALRAQTNALQDRINQQVAEAVQDSTAAQTAANEITILAAIAALLLAAVAAWQLRTSFAKPLHSLVGQVQRVSGGDLDHSVDVSGPQELVTVSQTVEAMRVRILAESAKSATAARLLARYEEAERIASQLGDTVIRQLFTASLALQSAASRYPAVAPVIGTVIADIDRALKDLQVAIFELTSAPTDRPLGNQVLDLVDQWESGTAPEVQLAGSLDDERLGPVAADVVDVVRDVLTTIVRPGAGRSTISLSADADTLRLRITGPARAHDDESSAGVRERAERLDGGCTVAHAADTVTVVWWIPVPAANDE